MKFVEKKKVLEWVKVRNEPFFSIAFRFSQWPLLDFRIAVCCVFGFGGVNRKNIFISGVNV